MRIGYGLSQTLAAFVGQDGRQTGAQLRALGFDGVFVKTHDPEWLAGLRESGLSLYASLTCFMGAGVWRQFPGSRPVLPDGAPAPKDDWYEPALPTLPKLRAARLTRLEALAKLPLDGVWLDFIRWPARWETPEPALYHSSFDLLTLRQFEQDTGLIPPRGVSIADWLLQEVADHWFTWRCQQIASFVALAKARLPNRLLGVFIVPWTDEDAIDGIAAPNRHIVGQDLALLELHADVISPMVYHRLCGRSVAWPAEVVRLVKGRVNTPVWPVVETLREDANYTPHEFEIVLAGVSVSGADALVVFNLDGVLSHPARLEALRRHAR